MTPFVSIPIYITGLLWMLFEYFFSYRQQGSRFGARPLLNAGWFSIAEGLHGLAFIAGFLLIISSASSSIRVMSGTGLIWWGLWSRWYAIQTLGHYFTADISIFHPHPIIEAGLYKLIRHPQYMGKFITWCGLAVCIGKPGIFFVAFAGAELLIMALIEEHLLNREWGKAYQNYRHRNFRFIPYLY